jgi:hypothetical protein
MGLKFSIPEQKRSVYTHRILDLCEYLSEKVMNPFCACRGVQWDRRFVTHFTHDTSCDPFASTGMIIFHPPQMFAGQLGEMQNSIKRELDRLNIKTGEFTLQYSPDRLSVKAIQIPITNNPTSQSGPPEVSMSDAAGCLVLRDLLGCDRADGQYKISAEEVLKKVTTVTDLEIVNRSSSPFGDVKLPHGARPKPSPMTIQRIRRCLEELKQLASWAMRHNYHYLMAS